METSSGWKENRLQVLTLLPTPHPQNTHSELLVRGGNRTGISKIALISKLSTSENCLEFLDPILLMLFGKRYLLDLTN